MDLLTNVAGVLIDRIMISPLTIFLTMSACSDAGRAYDIITTFHLLYATTFGLLMKAKAMSQHCGEIVIDETDVQMTVDFVFSALNYSGILYDTRPRRPEVVKIASDRNRQPLPQVRHNFGLKLPNDSLTLNGEAQIETQPIYCPTTDSSAGQNPSSVDLFIVSSLGSVDTLLISKPRDMLAQIIMKDLLKFERGLNKALEGKVSTVFECGVLPTGQGSTRNFTVTGFTLPVAMAYSTAPDVPPQASGIATSAEGARRFVDRLIMQTVFDVLESQARSALLSDPVISAILSQLTVTVTYTPLMCPKVRIGVEDPSVLNMGESACIIVDGTVTAICTNMNADAVACAPVPPGGANAPKITPVHDSHLTISGSLSV
ncbi:hypothetical protein KIN20_004345 [Parelaphostrongylus tenuis]|uniref:Uncharacterized protein n=1 Tax=Parelaphostrongylus tenuis TaxID=148309 RepID=A0AAD5MH59_PARTN|nr:hypothetical protein KIN20_004345 [Parelaphostrongylus tenuis]